MQINIPEVQAQVTAAFYAYEQALMEDDIPSMDNLFFDSEWTIRYGVGEVLYGMNAIREFRKQRGGSPPRKLARVEITSFGNDFATANAEFYRDGSVQRGRQSQSWVRMPEGWKIVSAHVSLEGTFS
jgi:hypothetical protein